MRTNSMPHFLMPVVFAAAMSSLSYEVQSAPMCEISISIADFNSSKQPGEVHRSVAEAYSGRNQNSSFMVFALEVEKALLDAATRSLCSDDGKGSAISVDLMVVELGIASEDEQLQRLKSYDIGTRGSYVEVSVDQESRSVDATMIWNPRRMLRDQLELEGWKFDEVLPLLPFSQGEFTYWIDRYTSEVLTRRSMDTSMAVELLLQNGMPKDLSGLLTSNIQTTRVPFRGLVLSNVENLIKSSAAGYTRMSVEVVELGFQSDSPTAINSIGEIGLSEIEDLYKTAPWSLLARPSD